MTRQNFGLSDNRIGNFLWAIALVVGGLFLLLFNLDVFVNFEPTIQYVLTGILAVAGIGFFGSYVSARQNWWRLIPAWTLLALAGMVYLTTLADLDQRLTAALLFIGQALAFAHIYFLNRSEHWWAVIPGGFMLVLGGVIALSSLTEKPETLGTALFIGMGAVFFLLYLVGGRRRQWWALIPGSVLVVFGFLLFTVGYQENTLLKWWPVLLMALGLFLGWRAYTVKPKRKLPVQTSPNLSRRERGARPSTVPPAPGGRLGEYSGPAPGASVEELPDNTNDVPG